MNKEAIQQQAEAFLKTNRAFYGEEGFQAYGPYGEKAVALMIAEFAAQCAPVGGAPQADKSYIAIEVDKTAPIMVGDEYYNVAAKRIEKCEYEHEAKSCNTYKPDLIWKIVGSPFGLGENYGTESSNTDEAVGATLHSGSGNSVEQGWKPTMESVLSTNRQLSTRIMQVEEQNKALTEALEEAMRILKKCKYK